jgi:heptosyltransferase II
MKRQPSFHYPLRRTWERRRISSQPAPPTLGFDKNLVNRILVICTAAVGDTVMCTPTMAETRRLFPDARLVGFVPGRIRELLEPTGWFDEFFVYDGSAFPLHPAKIRSLRRWELRVRQEQFQLALILWNDDFAPLLIRTGIGWRVGDRDGYFAGHMTHTFAGGDSRTWGPDTRLNALRCLGLRPNPVPPKLVVSPETRADVRQRLTRLGITEGCRLVLFHPFSFSPNRQLPLPKAARLLSRMAAELDAHAILIGGPHERQEWERTGISLPERSFSLIGELSLQVTAALIERADVVLTTDSGPFHLAGALDRPAVGLFRAIRPELARLYPTASCLFWDHGAECLNDCTWSACQSLPCRQLVGIDENKIIEAVGARLLQPHFGGVRCH